MLAGSSPIAPRPLRSVAACSGGLLTFWKPILTPLLERPVDGVRVSLDTVQTFDRYHFDARVELDGRPFFRRAWDLDLPYRERLW